MSRVASFPPLVGSAPRVLILGSMPGVKSLQAGQYYAHPQNGFWPILGTYCGFAADLPYEARCRALVGRGIAVWDVLQSCERKGSLDTAIVATTERPNDLAGFCASFPTLRGILCNGAKAAATLTRCRSSLSAALEVVALPSTSPAHTLARAEKARRWHEALARFLTP